VKFQRYCRLQARLKVELQAGSGRHFAVIGSSAKGRWGFRRWPAWDLIFLFRMDLWYERIFSQRQAKAFYLGN